MGGKRKGLIQLRESPTGRNGFQERIQSHRLVETIPDDIRRDSDAKRGCLLQAIAFALVAGVSLPCTAALLLLCLNDGFGPISWLASLLTGFIVCGAVRLSVSLNSCSALPPKYGYPTVTLIGDSLQVRCERYLIKVDLQECRVRAGPATGVKFFCRKSRGTIIGQPAQVLLIDIPPFGFGPLGQIEAYTTVAVGFTTATREAWTAAFEATLGTTPYTPDAPAVTAEDAGADVTDFDAARC